MSIQIKDFGKTIDYEKRLKWQNTIFAWFAKWLQDDGSWWTEMYGDEKM